MVPFFRAYLMQFDADSRIVLASNVTKAIEIWKIAMSKEWGDEYDGTEEPDRITTLDCDGQVIVEEMAMMWPSR